LLTDTTGSHFHEEPYNPRYYDILIEDFQNPGIGTYSRVRGQLRPHAEEFVAFCNRYFANVIVWSAGKYSYVHKLVQVLFRSTDPPVRVFTFDDLPFNENGKVIKDLKIIYDQCSYLPYPPNMYNTIIIDDDASTFILNPENAIHIPRFEGDPQDTALNYISAFLISLDVIYAQDVRMIKFP